MAWILRLQKLVLSFRGHPSPSTPAQIPAVFPSGCFTESPGGEPRKRPQVRCRVELSLNPGGTRGPGGGEYLDARSPAGGRLG